MKASRFAPHIWVLCSDRMDSFFENCLRRNVSLNNSLTNPQFLPLREITLNSRPLVKRAIQFSCDGDLAVAADDSVHIFAPEFPDFSKRRTKRKALADGRQNGASYGNLPYDDLSCSDDEEEESDTGPGRYNRQPIRAQYSEGSKHMPVSYPPLDPRVNRELFAAAQIPFPYEDAVSADADGQVQSDDSNDDSVSGSDASDSEGEDGDAAQGFNRPYGAGYGPITGVGSSMNHVVCVGWSPSGLGVNRRPILAVLTGSGTLVVYGDGSEFANILPRANDGMLQRRELNSWVVLWGVGERLLVPGQQTKVSEYIRSFAWAREIAPGQALLATVNDVKEVAIISVQSVLVVDDGKTKGDSSFRTEPRENSVWLVREIARFKADGPHEASNVSCPHQTRIRRTKRSLTPRSVDGPRSCPLWHFLWPPLGPMAGDRQLSYLRALLRGPELRWLPTDHDQRTLGQERTSEPRGWRQGYIWKVPAPVNRHICRV